MNNTTRVFLGLGNTAGIFTSLKKGFLEIGIQADFYSFHPHVFGYKNDRFISYSSNGFVRKFQKIVLLFKLISKYKYFIFDTSSTLLPNYNDIGIFRFFGKKTMVICTGCDIRIPEKVFGYKWNPCKDCSNEYKKFVGCEPASKPVKLKKLEDTFDFRVSAEEAASGLTKKYYPILFPVDLAEFPVEMNKPNRKIKIVHAPTNEIYKGTKYIIEAIGKLKRDFDFEFKILSGLKIGDLRKEISNCDLVIDQMLVGFYGLLSIESMAMYKPIICYIREDIWKNLKHTCPVYNANPDNIYGVLKSILKAPEQLVEAGIKSRRYVEKYHDAAIVAKNLLNILNN